MHAVDVPPSAHKKDNSLSRKIHLHAHLWPFLVPILVVCWIFWPHRLWPTLLIILGGTWLISLLWALSLKSGLSLERRMRYGWAQVGDRMEERFTVINNSYLPGLLLELEDHSNLPEYSAGRITQVGGREIMDWRTQGMCNQRGLFTVGPTSLRSGDPLGLFMVEITVPDKSVLLILPPILHLPGIGIAAGGRSGEGRRPRRSALETTVSTDTVRGYIPGEPLKTIHWPTSARRDSLYVRQFEHTPAADWWIFLDLDIHKQVGSGYDSTEEHGVILAASLAARGLREGHNVGLVTAGPGFLSIPPRRTSNQLMEVLRPLALVHPGEITLGDLLKNTRMSMQRGASIILVTPDVEGGWVPDLFHMVSKEVTPTVLLLDPASYGGKGSSTGLLVTLTRHGIANHLISRSLLNSPEAQPGNRGKWEWRVVGPGKAVVMRRPLDNDWRRLA
jgi:uncharacterized protein (DUF58 family)